MQPPPPPPHTEGRERVSRPHGDPGPPAQAAPPPSASGPSRSLQSWGCTETPAILPRPSLDSASEPRALQRHPPTHPPGSTPKAPGWRRRCWDRPRGWGQGRARAARSSPPPTEELRTSAPSPTGRGPLGTCPQSAPRGQPPPCSGLSPPARPSVTDPWPWFSCGKRGHRGPLGEEGPAVGGIPWALLGCRRPGPYPETFSPRTSAPPGGRPAPACPDHPVLKLKVPHPEKPGTGMAGRPRAGSWPCTDHSESHGAGAAGAGGLGRGGQEEPPAGGPWPGQDGSPVVAGLSGLCRAS